MAFATPPRVPVTFPAKQSTMDMARERGSMFKLYARRRWARQ